MNYNFELNDDERFVVKDDEALAKRIEALKAKLKERPKLVLVRNEK